MNATPSSLERPPPSESWASIVAKAKPSERDAVLGDFSEEDLEALEYDWRFWGRGKQIAPDDDWTTWVLLSGRGFGKSRAGAEWFREQAEKNPGSRGMLLGSTPADVRDVMVEGPSGLLSVCPPWNRPNYNPSKRRLEWPNGFIASIRSAHNPEAVRGPEQEFCWSDELAAWPADKGRKAWDNMLFGLRYGERPRVCVTTTPKYLPLLLEIIAAKDSAVVTGTTYENVANLAPTFLHNIITKYEGTSLGRQEIYAQLLGEVDGALWTRKLIDATRVSSFPDLVRIVVGVDPSGGVSEIGIVTVGIGPDGHIYVLSDASLRSLTDAWATAVITDYSKFKADIIVGEQNYGGEMVRQVLKTKAEELGQSFSYKDVHATRGKQVRAQPVSGLWEQKRAHMVGNFPQLEGEMCNWVPGENSPNRMDALVWACTELIDPSRVSFVEAAWG